MRDVEDFSETFCLKSIETSQFGLVEPCCVQTIQQFRKYASLKNSDLLCLRENSVVPDTAQCLKFRPCSAKASIQLRPNTGRFKIFTRTVYKRVKPILEAQQSKDQIRFRSSVGVDDAFAVLENVCSKSMEWSVVMWCAGLDLRKAFDRIEYNALFDAFKVQGVPHAYLQLIVSWYHDQIGLVQGRQFPIKRGVKQGDVPSPLLFNAGSEHAMRKWNFVFNIADFIVVKMGC